MKPAATRRGRLASAAQSPTSARRKPEGWRNDAEQGGKRALCEAHGQPRSTEARFQGGEAPRDTSKNIAEDEMIGW